MARLLSFYLLCGKTFPGETQHTSIFTPDGAHNKPEYGSYPSTTWWVLLMVLKEYAGGVTYRSRDDSDSYTTKIHSRMGDSFPSCESRAHCTAWRQAAQQVESVLSRKLLSKPLQAAGLVSQSLPLGFFLWEGVASESGQFQGSQEAVLSCSP